MVDLNKYARKTLEIVFLIAVIALSVVIYVYKDDITEVDNVGYAGLLILCFLSNSTIFLPSPSLLLAASCALILNPWLVALFAAIGTSLGEMVGYAIGSVSTDLSPKIQKKLNKVTKRVPAQSTFVFILAVLPLPLFDIAGLYSGGTKMNLAKFFISCFMGKFIKTLAYTRMYDILEWVTSMI